MDRIYVPSAATAEELAEKGIRRQKLIVHQWGVDTAFFHPARKNGFMDQQYGVPADSADGFVNRILDMAKNPGHLQKLKESARQYMEQRSFENCFLRFWARD